MTRHGAPSLLLAACLAGSLCAAAGDALARGGGGGGGGGPGGGFGVPGGHYDRNDPFRSHRRPYLTDEYDEIRRLRQRGEILSLEQILQHARLGREGRVLESFLEKERGRYVYNIELVDEQGQVWEMELDAATGEVLENHRED